MKTPEIVLAVATSFVASFLFWLLFNCMPDRRRRNKIRPKVEFDIYEIYFNLFFYIDLAFFINETDEAYPQERIHAGMVTKEEFGLWLQNKCMAEIDRRGEMGKYLIPMGDRLKKTANSICKKIDKCSAFYEFMTAEEILLLRKIGSQLCTYTYESLTEVKNGRVTFSPADPTLSYMAEHFYQVYQLYLELQEMVWDYHLLDRSIGQHIFTDFNIARANKHLYNGEYVQCLVALEKTEKKEDYGYLSVKFQCLSKMENEERAEVALRELLSRVELEPVYIRGTFRNVLLDEKLIDILKQYHTEEQVRRMLEELNREQIRCKAAVQRAKQIRQYYAQKAGITS